MARVICNLPFAAEVISGVKFLEDRGERISEEIGDEAAKLFASIPGFRLAGEKKGGAKSPDAPKDAPKADAPAADAPKDAPKGDAPKPAAPADAPKSGGDAAK